MPFTLRKHQKEMVEVCREIVRKQRRIHIMSRVLDLTGHRFGRLTVIEFDGIKTRHRAYWICKCECGQVKSICGHDLMTGYTKSCGCLRADNGRLQLTKHGKSRTRLYYIYQSMKQRCNDKNHHAYKDYGGRGIVVCNEWMAFNAFYDWAIKNGYRENAGLSIDRINVDGNYCPENCRWAIIDTQANNKRSNKYFELNGEHHSIAEWAKILGGSASLIHARLRKGWSIEKALSIPVRKKRKQG
jgi:hypothetical protein